MLEAPQRLHGDLRRAWSGAHGCARSRVPGPQRHSSVSCSAVDGVHGLLWRARHLKDISSMRQGTGLKRSTH